MKPLVGVTCYNRLELTQRTLASLSATAGPNEYDLCIVDNGSADGTADWLRANVPEQQLHLLTANLGCPVALNLILQYRLPGQPFVKLDNDVEIRTPGWIGVFQEFEARYDDVGMIGAWYDGVTDGRFIDWVTRSNKVDPTYRPAIDAALVGFVPGHFVWHTARLIDQAGHFDVLGEGHLYGHEDRLMCERARMLGLGLTVMPSVRIRNIQDRKSYADFGGQGKDEHVERWRAEAEARVQGYWAGKLDTYVGPGGNPEMLP